MTLAKKRFLLLALFLFGIALLFLPIRVDHVSGFLSEDVSARGNVVPANEDHYCSVVSGFNGHPVGVVGIIFFALMPFLVVLQSFSMRRPFGLATTAFLKLQATLMFIGGPYVWYIITYQQGYFANTVHDTSPGWGGWLLIAYVIGSGMTLYWMLAVPKGKLAGLFDAAK